MEKEFVTYEIGLELKNLGFNECCYGCFSHLDNRELRTSRVYTNRVSENIAAPIFSQAFRWFREKYNIDAWVQPFVSEKQNGKPFLPDESYVYYIFKDGVYVDDAVNFLNYEEAELACLQKLIEILKTK